MSNKTKAVSTVVVSCLLLSGLIFQISTTNEPANYISNQSTISEAKKFSPVTSEVEEVEDADYKELAELSDVYITEPVNPPKKIEPLTAEDIARSPEETVFTTMTTQGGVTWGLDRTDGTMDGQYTYISGGSGVKIYIVDTGVDSAHPDLTGKVLDGFDSFGQNLDQTDCNGHGTHVAAIASGNYYGVAKESRVIPVRVLDCSGRGNTTTLALGINWILDNHSGGVGIVNMSLGGPRDSEVNGLVSELVSAGLVVVVAAGNSNADACNFSPASAPGVIAVGAVDRGDVVASFSNWGTCVDISAPGVSINSANSKDYGISSRKSGTSQASPFVAGAIATYISNGSVSRSLGAEPYARSLSTNGVVSVEVAEAPEDVPVESEPLPSQPELSPEPEPVVEPEPEAPENIDNPEEPSNVEMFVQVDQLEVGSHFGTIRWSPIKDASTYKIYRTSPARPSWQLYGSIRSEQALEFLVTTPPGMTARYRVIATVGSELIIVGEFRYRPK
jgi:subtilisin family serine protease